MRKDIKGFEGFYYVKDNGDIYSVDRIAENSLGRKCFFKGKKIKIQISARGYARVQLSKPGMKKKKYSVHRIVAEAFLTGKTEERNVVNHKDGNKLNNHVDNLEWCTQSENLIHSFRTKLRKVKFTDDEIRLIRNWKGSLEELGDYFQCETSQLCHIRSRKRYFYIED
ncbi:MAG: NUMOD4 motif-containing HNH endonuclease [Fusobacterium sp.]|uniref:NUMOD4 motif-containing HNH endonuclease n=1 Tax=Fusobacterium sp. TaxID=68766 RepID=UPI003991DD16